MAVSEQAAQDDVEKGFAEETGTRRRRRSRVASQTPLKPPAQEELAVQKKQEAAREGPPVPQKIFDEEARSVESPRSRPRKNVPGAVSEVFDGQEFVAAHARESR